MEYSRKNSLVTKNDLPVDEIQAAKVRFVENQFGFKFDPWLHGLTMRINYPVKVYTWLMASQKYSVSWDDKSKTMSFDDNPNESPRYGWAVWGFNRVKSCIGKEIYEHFGKVNFKINGEIVP